MISKSLLLLAFAALAHCQAVRQLWCASTWTGQSLDLPICTTMTAYPEMSKQCLQSEVNGSRQLMYTIDKDDTDFCLSVVIRSRDDYTGAEETHVYRGPINVFQVKTCEEYCQGVIDSKKWFKDEFNMTLTPLYVSCWNKNVGINDETLVSVVGAGAGANTYKCENITNYAKDRATALEKGPSEPNPPAANNLNNVTNTHNITTVVKAEKDADSEYASIPGWYFISLAVQVVSLVIALGALIYTIMLYVGVKNSAEVAPDFEMK